MMDSVNSRSHIESSILKCNSESQIIGFKSFSLGEMGMEMGRCLNSIFVFHYLVVVSRIRRLRSCASLLTPVITVFATTTIVDARRWRVSWPSLKFPLWESWFLTGIYLPGNSVDWSSSQLLDDVHVQHVFISWMFFADAVDGSEILPTLGFGVFPQPVAQDMG